MTFVILGCWQDANSVASQEATAQEETLRDAKRLYAMRRLANKKVTAIKFNA